MITMTAPRITAGLVPVEFGNPGPAMHPVQIDAVTLIVGYDPRVLDADLVTTILQSVHGADLVIVEEVPE
ncbi:hypothetical protein ACGFZP_13050 [Kitasatospora sp. NPDC048239]|uniref:hypothetical protein n=1 Tax=Kitasatospora sp. NPDC048239 TaxID=3364046 RepID=UPI0037136804